MAGRHEDSDDESYVRIGSAFEILQTDEDIVKAKEKKQKDQYVLDKQGRRRFHGAFTGGFSAGYYNTVGSKEGWVPSSFVSSRSTKSQSKRQRPEDYMDEDDLDIFGIAPREVSTREPFEQGTTTSIKKPVSHLSVIPGEPLLQDFIIPAQSTVGKVLLKSMGWREGQGVGPKVLRSAKTADEDDVKVYGCSLPDENVFMFAPHDIAPWQYVSKVDDHGIGYQGMLEQGVLSTTGYSGSVYGMSGQAFGVGALEDDDEDIYSQESITSYNRTMTTDIELSRAQDFGWTGHKTDSWSLEMFDKMKSRSRRDKTYPPPVVPKSFVPVHVFTSCPVEQKEGLPLVVSASERGHLLSEPLGSVFDLMSSTDRERVKKLAQQAKKLKDTSEKSSKYKDTSEKSSKYKDTNEKSSKYEDTNEKSSKYKDTSEKSSNYKDTSEKSSKYKANSEKMIPYSLPERTNDIGDRIISGTYQPYADNPSKQARYEAYLKGCRKFNDHESRQFTEWEKQKELDEFSRKARLFQPLSQALSDKFRQSSSEDTDHVEENQDATEAAAIGMFGVMTREVLEWHPHSVICKRFNVPDPYPNSDVVGIPLRLKSSTRLNKVMQFELSTSSSMLATEKVEKQELPISEEFNLTNEAEQPITEVDEPIIEEIQRPSMSVFVSIFAESKSEDENDPSDVTMATEELPMEVDVPHSDKKWQNLSHISLPLPTVSVQIEPPIPVEPELFGPALPPPTSFELTNETTKSEHRKHKSSHHKKGKHKHSRH